MKIEYLQEFVVLSKYLNFSMTAELLHITQPVLSRHIAALEDELGVLLLQRSTQSVTLTEEGRIALDRINKILGDYDELKSVLRLREMGYESSLCIGIPYYAMEFYLGSIPEQFEALYPKIKLKYEVGDPHEVLELLRQGKTDIIIIPKLSYPQINQFVSYELFQERLGVLVSRKNPIAAGKACSIEQLRDQLFFSVDNDYYASSWEKTREVCKCAGFNPRGPKLFSVMEAALIAARRGDGVIVAGEHMRIHESKELAFLELTDPGCSRPVCMWTRKKGVSEVCKMFIKIGVKESLKRQGESN